MVELHTLAMVGKLLGVQQVRLSFGNTSIYAALSLSKEMHMFFPPESKIFVKNKRNKGYFPNTRTCQLQTNFFFPEPQELYQLQTIENRK